jgi:hypothetical protein
VGATKDEFRSGQAARHDDATRVGMTDGTRGDLS